MSNDIAEDITVPPLAPSAPTTNSTVNENDPNPINRYCTCSQSTCKCCREIGLPILPVRGPGCATMQYLEDDKMLVTIQYGDFVLAQRQISGSYPSDSCIIGRRMSNMITISCESRQTCYSHLYSSTGWLFAILRARLWHI